MMRAPSQTPYLSLRWGVFFCEVGWVFCVGRVCGRGAGQQKSVELLGLRDRNLQEQTLHHQFLHLRTETWNTDTIIWKRKQSSCCFNSLHHEFQKIWVFLWVCMCERMIQTLERDTTLLCVKHRLFLPRNTPVLIRRRRSTEWLQ